MNSLRTRSIALLMTVLLLGLPVTVLADMVVVANPKSGVERLSVEDVINIFMGRYRELPGSIPALPVDLPASDPVRERFYQRLVGKDLAQINAYWARLVLSGRTMPPLRMEGAEEAIRYVATHRGAVAYLERPKADARVRIVLELP